jgi:DNA-binding transcriptional MerR regulator
MPELHYSITELEKLTGLGRRTIHFYIKEGVVPPPEGLGSTAKYVETHYLRLRLIKYLQRTHLKLSGIKEFLDSMQIEDMRDYLGKAETNSGIESDLSITSFSKSLSSAYDHLSLSTENADMFSDHEDDLLINYLKTVPAPPSSKRSSWRHIEIADGVEMHIREDVYRRKEQKITRAAELIRRELGEEGK